MPRSSPSPAPPLRRCSRAVARPTATLMGSSSAWPATHPRLPLLQRQWRRPGRRLLGPLPLHLRRGARLGCADFVGNFSEFAYYLYFCCTLFYKVISFRFDWLLHTSIFGVAISMFDYWFGWNNFAQALKHFFSASKTFDLLLHTSIFSVTINMFNYWFGWNNFAQALKFF